MKQGTIFAFGDDRKPARGEWTRPQDAHKYYKLETINSNLDRCDLNAHIERIDG